MESKLDTANCLDVYTFGKQHMCEHLTNKSREFIARHFNELIKTREFVEMEDVELLGDVLGCDELEVSTEEVVVEALLAWLKHKPDSRRAHAQRLFADTVRLDLVDAAYLCSLVQTHTEAVTSSLVDLLARRLDEEKWAAERPRRDDKPRAGMAKAQQCFLLLGGSATFMSSASKSDDCDEGNGGAAGYVNCVNLFNGEKYFLSTSYLDKPSYISKGFFHVEYPGKIVNSFRR